MGCFGCCDSDCWIALYHPVLSCHRLRELCGHCRTQSIPCAGVEMSMHRWLMVTAEGTVYAQKQEGNMH